MTENIDLDSFDIVYELINNPDELDECWKDFDFLVSDEIYDRLDNWISFFNSNHTKSLCIYSNSIYSLFYAAKYNQIFRTQTRYEFETSLEFYKKAINSDYFIYFSTIEEATFFLNISLIYGCYPGMVVGSVNKAFSVFSKTSNLEGLYVIFKVLFVKYESPTILINNLNYLKTTEIEALMYILQGNNIRLFNKLPFPISKKESFIFINKLPNQLKFKEDVLERSLVFSKLLLKSTNSNLLLRIINSSKIFQYKLFTFYNDITFWSIVLNILDQMDWSERTIYSLQDYIDYFEFKRYSSEDEYDLKGRTIESINRSIFEWHETSSYNDLLKKIDLKWNGIVADPVNIKIDNNQFLIKEITNGKDLFREADYLKHCVYSYIESCASGFISVWSLSKKVDSTFLPCVTIEVQKNSVVQAAGKRNRKIDDIEMQIICDWAKKMNYSVELF